MKNHLGTIVQQRLYEMPAAGATQALRIAAGQTPQLNCS